MKTWTWADAGAAAKSEPQRAPRDRGHCHRRKAASSTARRSARNRACSAVDRMGLLGALAREGALDIEDALPE
jgi:hypothetical protein